MIPRRLRRLRGVELIINDLLLHALIGDEERQRQRIGIKVTIARDTANAAGRTDLPIRPAVLGAGIDVVTATAAAVPWIAGVQVLAVIMSDPCRENARGAEIAHSISGAGVDYGTQEMRSLRLHVSRPGVEPCRVAAGPGV